MTEIKWGDFMNALVDRAVKVVDDVLSLPNGSDLMYVGGIYYSLSLCELDKPLSNEELVKLTERVFEASGSSVVPVLTAERVDAVRFMLEYGVSADRSPELVSVTADQARGLLLSCDLEVFTDLVDAVAVDGHGYYDQDLNIYNSELLDRVNSVLSDVLDKQLSLDDVVQNAESTKETAELEGIQPGRIYDATNERYI